MFKLSPPFSKGLPCSSTTRAFAAPHRSSFTINGPPAAVVPVTSIVVPHPFLASRNEHLACAVVRRATPCSSNRPSRTGIVKSPRQKVWNGEMESVVTISALSTAWPSSPHDSAGDQPNSGLATPTSTASGCDPGFAS